MISGNMNDVLSYIPQRRPFVMIDELVRTEDGSSATSFLIKERGLFVRNGLFIEAGLVENMAQTVAAMAGYTAQQSGKAVSVGYIAAIKNLEIDALPAIGDTIITEAFSQHDIAGIKVVSAKVLNMGTEIARCEMKIFVRP